MSQYNLRSEGGHSQNRSSTVIVYHDVCLKKRDVDLLRGPFWLNDQIIAFYFQYLEFAKFSDVIDNFLFVPPAVTQILKMKSPDDCVEVLRPLKPDKRKLLLFAVNDNDSARAGGTHWSLLVYSRDEGTFFNFDSLSDFNTSNARKIFTTLKNLLNCPFGNFKHERSAQQTNSYDCGIYLLVNAENVCNNFLLRRRVQDTPIASLGSINAKRQEILSIIDEINSN